MTGRDGAFETATSATGAGDQVVDPAVDLAFREAMRRLAGTVTIVTVSVGGERHGTTATAVTSLSMAPPSLLCCFNRDSRLHAKLLAADRFCVNLLHADDVEMSRLFSSPVSSEARFAGDRWSTPANGAPALADAQSSIQCIKDRQVDYGSHTIFIGRVTQASNRDAVSPLVYCNGSYSCATPLPKPG